MSDCSPPPRKKHRTGPGPWIGPRLPKPPPPTEPAHPVVTTTVRRRAQRRWHALLDRIGLVNGLRAALPPAAWQAFVRQAEAWHKPAYLRAFQPAGAVIACAGPLAPPGAPARPCPNAVALDAFHPSVLRGLAGVHIDHGYRALFFFIKYMHQRPLLTSCLGFFFGSLCPCFHAILVFRRFPSNPFPSRGSVCVWTNFRTFAP